MLVVAVRFHEIASFHFFSAASLKNGRLLELKKTWIYFRPIY